MSYARVVSPTGRTLFLDLSKPGGRKVEGDHIILDRDGKVRVRIVKLSDTVPGLAVKGDYAAASLEGEAPIIWGCFSGIEESEVRFLADGLYRREGGDMLCYAKKEGERWRLV